MEENECINLIESASKIVEAFGKGVLELGENEMKIAQSNVAKAIVDSANTIILDGELIAKTVFQDIKRFESLKLCWEYILENSKKIDIWRINDNFFPG